MEAILIIGSVLSTLGVVAVVLSVVVILNRLKGKVDVRDLEKLENSISLASPEIVIHMAAQSLVLESYNT